MDARLTPLQTTADGRESRAEDAARRSRGFSWRCTVADLSAREIVARASLDKTLRRHRPVMHRREARAYWGEDQDVSTPPEKVPAGLK